MPKPPESAPSQKVRCSFQFVANESDSESLSKTSMPATPTPDRYVNVACRNESQRFPQRLNFALTPSSTQNFRIASNCIKGFFALTSEPITLHQTFQVTLTHRQQQTRATVEPFDPATPPPLPPLTRPNLPQAPRDQDCSSNMASDLEMLLDMGFDKTRAELAVKKSGGRAYFRVSTHI